ncbi:MAG TPA: D-alanyl-D-alanine carboxypeptidase family protein [Usitatibacter sp.]|jgi:D-alanyl-D-alanine carboxypeptidase (penicillin-binding protein 5/6)|nr:D-alanyl-D-alanine carboxypeptidase family protein [Usitatibacter sp.]
MKKLLAVVLAWLAIPAPAHAQAPVTPPPIAARAYLLVDAQSGATLAAAAENDRFEPASLTKLMTAYLVFGMLRDHKLDAAQKVVVSPHAAQAHGSRMFIEAGTTASIDELLKGLVVQSANDAAVALAEAAAGTEQAFVELMNRQAAKMGLANTHFSNASGEPADNHYSSARDMAALAMALIRDFPDEYARYAQKEFVYNHVRQTNRNRLLWIDATVDGLKTGFTEAAGYCLIASAKRGERRLVSVVMGAESESLRVTESQKLLNFGFQAYETRRLYAKGQSVGEAEVFKGTRRTARLGFDHDVWLTLPRDRFDRLKAVLQTRQPFVAPLAAGEKAGIMKIMRDSTLVAELPVTALDDVPVAGFLSRGWDTVRLMIRGDKP